MTFPLSATADKIFSGERVASVRSIRLVPIARRSNSPSFHDLLNNNRVKPHIAARWLGHSIQIALKHYARIKDADYARMTDGIKSSATDTIDIDSIAQTLINQSHNLIFRRGKKTGQHHVEKALQEIATTITSA